MRRKLKKNVSLAAAAAMAAVQCGSSGLFGVIAAGETSSASTSFPYTIEGENLEGATLWTSIYENQIPGYSGEGFAYLTNDEISFTVNVPEDGMYSVMVKGAQILDAGGRQQTIKINGTKYTKKVPYAMSGRILILEWFV